MIVKNNLDLAKQITLSSIKLQLNIIIFQYFIPSLLGDNIGILFRLYIIQNLLYAQFMSLNIISLTYKMPDIISEILLLDTYFHIEGKQRQRLEEKHFTTIWLFSFASSLDQLQDFPVIIVKQLYQKFNNPDDWI